MKQELGSEDKKSEQISWSELNADRINLAERVVEVFDPLMLPSYIASFSMNTLPIMLKAISHP